VTELYLFVLGGVVAVVVGVLGVFVERARARSGYLAKQYHDLLALLLALEHSPADQPKHTAADQPKNSPVDPPKTEREKALRNFLRERSRIEAAVLLFGKPKVASEVLTLYKRIAQAGAVPSQFDEGIVQLAKDFRGPRLLLKLSPQRRWFRPDAKDK
jgi:hypothetical protein